MVNVKSSKWLSASVFWLGLLCGLLYTELSLGATLTLRASVYDKLDNARKLIEQGKYDSGKALLNKVKKMPNLNAFEQAQTANFLAFYYYENNNYSRAIQEYLKVVKTREGLPAGLYNQTLYTLAQLYFEKEDYSSALKFAKRWFNTAENPSADAYMLVGQAQYMLKDYKAALPNVRLGINKYISSKKKPKENWLLLLRGIYFELGDYKNLVPTIKRLINYYPKDQYLFTLAGAYGELGQEKAMLGVLEALYDSGYLQEKPKQLVNLANLFVYHDLPIKAAGLLEKEFKSKRLAPTEKNLKLLAQAYSAAKEYELAISPLKKLVANSGKAEYHLQLAYLYFSLNRWAKAEEMLALALTKKDLKNKGETLINLGLARLEQSKYKLAKKAFTGALSYKSSKKDANKWLEYTNSEINRMEELNT